MSAGSAPGPGHPTALIADDERLMREQLALRLHEAWPALHLVAEARDGLEAVALADQHRPQVVFLDIRMPGQSGIEAAQQIVDLPDWRGSLVFVTAFDDQAVQAFEQGAIDYLLKPVERGRLQRTVERLQAHLRAGAAPLLAEDDAVLAILHRLQRLQHPGSWGSGPAAPAPLRWLQCSSGHSLRLIDVSEVLFFVSDEKYTRVQCATQEAFIRTPIRELAQQLDEQQFWQIHRSAIVNLAAIDRVWRDENSRLRVAVRQRPEVLEVSRSYAHRFRTGG